MALMRCDNCNMDLSPIVRIAFSGGYYYCSVMCREMHRRTQAAGAALDERLARDKDGGCYACNGTGLHEAIPNTKKWCDYCGGTGKRQGLEIPQVSVLSADDRATIQEARLWIRRILLVMQDSYLPGMEDGRVSHTVTLDGLERSSLYGVLEKLDALHSRHSGEPQLAGGKR